MSIAYTTGMKYQLKELATFSIDVDTWIFRQEIITPWVHIKPNGDVDVARGYAWNGISGYMPDFRSAIRASLIHDVFYQLIRLEYLPPEFKSIADEVFYLYMRRDNVNIAVAWTYKKGVVLFGGSSILPSNRQPTLYAP